jgi:hypothetical protein
MITSFLLCRSCCLLYPLSTGRGGDSDLSDAETAAELRAFRTAHATHPLERAERVPDDVLLDRPSWDPMATRWFHVAAGSDLLLVRSGRTSIEEPRRYHIEQTMPQVDGPVVDLDETLLRRALDRHFFPQVLRRARVDAVIAVVRELLDRLDAGEVEVCFDDHTLPNTGIGPFPAELCDLLLGRCATLFDDVEIERMQAFVRDHSGADGALALRVRRTVVRRAA